MELRDYLRILRRRWVLIVVVVALAAIAASVYVLLTPKKYAATSTLFVSTPASDPGSNNAYQGAQYSQLRVQSYVDMVNGSRLSQQVIDKLHLKMSPGQLTSEISASNKTNTVLLDITVTDRDPNLALRINQALVAQLTQTIEKIETPPGAKVPLINVAVVDPAQFSATPVSPKVRTDIALGIVVGLLLGFGVAVAREILDTSVKDLREVHGFADIPMIAALPLDSTVSSKPLISALDRQSPRSEAFRVLRTNLHFLGVDARSKVYVITSSVPGEGKSTTSTNLAISLAQAGERVLLVDGDLRRPRIAAMLGLVSAVGLTTALVGETSVSDCVQLHSESGLHVLAAGAVPPNPAELLQSQAMVDLLAQLREEFDIILIDTPPLLPVTDAALLGSVADGVLLMVRHSKTTKDQLQGAAHRLEAVDANLAGVIFNMVPRRAAAGTSGYSYGYGYGYGYTATAEQAGRRVGRTAKAEARAQAKAAAKAEAAIKAEAKAAAKAEAKAATEAANARDVESTDPPILPFLGPDPEEIAERDRQAAALALREREAAEELERELAERGRATEEPGPADETEPVAEREVESERKAAEWHEQPSTSRLNGFHEESLVGDAADEPFVPGRRAARRADGPMRLRRNRPTRED